MEKVLFSTAKQIKQRFAVDIAAIEEIAPVYVIINPGGELGLRTKANRRNAELTPAACIGGRKPGQICRLLAPGCCCGTSNGIYDRRIRLRPVCLPSLYPVPGQVIGRTNAVEFRANFCNRKSRRKPEVHFGPSRACRSRKEFSSADAPDIRRQPHALAIARMVENRNRTGHNPVIPFIDLTEHVRQSGCRGTSAFNHHALPNRTLGVDTHPSQPFLRRCNLHAARTLTANDHVSPQIGLGPKQECRTFVTEHTLIRDEGQCYPPGPVQHSICKSAIGDHQRCRSRLHIAGAKAIETALSLRQLQGRFRPSGYVARSYCIEMGIQDDMRPGTIFDSRNNIGFFGIGLNLSEGQPVSRKPGACDSRNFNGVTGRIDAFGFNQGTQQSDGFLGSFVVFVVVVRRQDGDRCSVALEMVRDCRKTKKARPLKTNTTARKGTPLCNCCQNAQFSSPAPHAALVWLLHKPCRTTARGSF